MKLNHLNLAVSDVSAAMGFLETYFGLTCVGNRGDSMAVMLDDDRFVLTLMKVNQVIYPKTFHIGFPQKNEEQVNTIHRRLKQNGYDVSSPKHAHSYTFYVKAPGGFTVEVSC